MRGSRVEHVSTPRLLLEEPTTASQVKTVQSRDVKHCSFERIAKRSGVPFTSGIPGDAVFQPSAMVSPRLELFCLGLFPLSSHMERRLEVMSEES